MTNIKVKKTFPDQDRKHDQVATTGFLVHWGETYAHPLIDHTHTHDDLEIIKKHD
jgi:hypothetical protein